MNTHPEPGPTVPSTAPPGAASDQRELGRVGPYHLINELGEGGCGIVYRAERREPFVQLVAIKVIKPGMDSSAVVARFEQERQALAVMDHPNIAKVLDGGLTDADCSLGAKRPYFVMQYVQGEPLTTYCDRHTLDIRARLELFIPVCEAIQHAHHKGVIHRDIKPSNVLVTVKDGHAIPVVIDFGVAKAVTHTLTQKAIFTEQGQLLGTPEYMSPEQAEMGALDVDTRTDIYSLGVVLYELLTGLLPFDSRTLRSAGYAEIRRIIREVEPPTPSTRLSAESPAPAQGSAVPGARSAIELARKRRTQLPDLTSLLRGELEWIPLKAMRKDRRERYATPHDLAEDVRAYLAGQPLRAGPLSMWYRLVKFVGRNRVAVAVGAAFVLVLAGAAILSTIGFVRAAQQRAVAIEERDTAQAALEFVNDDLFGDLSTESAGSDLRVTDLLAPASEALDQQFSKRPRVLARLAHTLGRAYMFIGQPKAALPLLEKALAHFDPTADPADRADAQARLVEARYRQLLDSNDAAVLRAAITDAERQFGPGTKPVLDLVNQLGGALKWAGELDEAEKAYRLALGGRTTLLGSSHVDVFITRHNLALVKLMRGNRAKSDGDAEAANTWYAAALAELESVIAEFGDRRTTSRALAVQWQGSRAEAFALRIRLKQDEAALAQYADLLSDLRATLGPTHWRTLDMTVWSARLLARNARLIEAAEQYIVAVTGARAEKGTAHEYTETVTREYADTLDKLGQSPRAIEVRTALYHDLASATAGPDRLHGLAALIADAHAKAGNAAEEARWRAKASAP